MPNRRRANLDPYKYQVGQELGVQFGDRFQNRERPCGYFGQVGGEMVRRVLANAFGPNSEAITPNQNAYYPSQMDRMIGADAIGATGAVGGNIAAMGAMNAAAPMATTRLQ